MISIFLHKKKENRKPRRQPFYFGAVCNNLLERSTMHKVKGQVAYEKKTSYCTVTQAMSRSCSSDIPAVSTRPYLKQSHSTWLHRTNTHQLVTQNTHTNWLHRTHTPTGYTKQTHDTWLHKTNTRHLVTQNKHNTWLHKTNTQHLVTQNKHTTPGYTKTNTQHLVTQNKHTTPGQTKSKCLKYLTTQNLSIYEFKMFQIQAPLLSFDKMNNMIFFKCECSPCFIHPLTANI